MRSISEPDDPSLALIFPEGYFALHPIAVAAIAAAGVRARTEGADVMVKRIPETHPLRYLARMGLFDAIGVDHTFKQQEHEPAGRFVPLRVISDGQELSDFVAELTPIFHDEPERIEPVKYVIAELVRNTLEHGGGSPAVAMVQAFPKAGTIAIGVADVGIGMRSSLARHHHVGNPVQAIELAMQPGVSGTTSRIGGNAENAGAGLFFCKSLAYISAQYFVVWSGDGMFKLLRRRPVDPKSIKARASQDRATRIQTLGKWPGTVLGVDISEDAFRQFAQFMKQMREVYNVDVKAQKKNIHKRKAMFR